MIPRTSQKTTPGKDDKPIKQKRPTRTPGADQTRIKRKSFKAEIESEHRNKSVVISELHSIVRAKWVHAYAELPKALQNMPPEDRINHVCSSKCMITGQDAMFVCVATGFVHTCSDLCSTREITESAEVCIFSGRTFPLSLSVEG